MHPATRGAFALFVAALFLIASPAAADADVSIDMTLDTPGPYVFNDELQYTIVVSNAGPSTATNIDVDRDTFNLNTLSVSGACSSFPCMIASLASGASATINVTARIAVTGAFDYHVSAFADEPDPDPSNNTDDTGNGGTSTHSTDLSITKTLDTAGPYTPGQSIQYTLAIANAGPSHAINVVVTDTPTNLTITGVSGAGCSALPCSFFALLSGNSTTITVTATIDAAGAFDNAASVTNDRPDPDESNNTDSSGNGGEATGADVSVVKSLQSGGPFQPGDSVTYLIQVSNAGPSVATNIQVTDTPTNLTITSVSDGCSALPCTIASMNPNNTQDIIVTATIDSAGAFDNSVIVSASEMDADLSNNTDDTGNGGDTAPSADVAVVKSIVTEGPYVQGHTVEFQTVVSNNGPSTATNIVVTDTPIGVTITSVSGAGCTAFPCTIPTLASGASETVTYSATINNPGSFDNSTNVDADELDPDTSNNSDPFGNGGVASNAVDVAITKTLDTAGPYAPGQTITYTLVVSNAGPGVALFAVVDDTPTNLTITGVSGSGCSAFPCTLVPGLTPGSSRTITVTATINSSGAFDNAATATPRSSDVDDDPSNNTDDTGNGGTTSADLAVAKSITTPTPYHQGDTVSFETVVTNNGPSDATNIVVTDTPIGVNLVAGSVSGAGCTAFPCTIPSLASGASATITYSGTIQNPGAFDNSTSVDADEYDHDTSNNSDPFGNGGVAQNTVDVAIAKTLDTPGPYTPGQTVTYTLVVSNTGPGVALFVVVTDNPTNLTITSVSGAGCSAFPCTLVPGLTPTPSSNRTITVTATIDAAGPFDNSATATPRSSDYDPDLSNNNASAGGVAASADVSVVKTLQSGGPFQPGDSVTYLIQVSNAGPSVATDIQVTDLPTNLTITGVSDGCSALPCTLASLNPNNTQDIIVTATIDAIGDFDNSVTVSAAEPDPDSSNNTDDTGNGGTTAPRADLAVAKSITTAAPYIQGQTVSFQTVVTNNGPDTATNVVVTDTPIGVTIVSVSGAGCTAFPCTIPSLANGASATITYSATIQNPGAFDNSTSVDADEFDPDTSNNSDPFGNGGVASNAVDLAITKTLDTAGPYVPGQTITYTLVVSNAGPGVALFAVVNDTPTNLTITSVSGGGCSAFPCTLIPGVTPTLASNRTITVTATIDGPGTFDNVATVTPRSSDVDPDLSNNTDATGNGGTVETTADLDLSMDYSPANPGQNDDVTYTLVLTNNGPLAATSVVVTDDLSDDADFVSASSTQGTCTGTDPVVCSVGTLVSGGSATMTIVVETPGNYSSLTNTATATADQLDPTPASASATFNCMKLKKGALKPCN